MKSLLNDLPNKQDVLIIGGGIVGAGIFRDLALHGVNTLLVDKKDFTSQTSQSSSKMLHGGIRYLENLDFNLVKEALSEKNLWLKLAPHLCFESPFLLPVYRESKRPLWMIRMGLALYDVLSAFENSPFQTLNANETLKRLPGLKKKGLKGAGLYFDAIMDDAKITLEVIYDALQEENAKALNYVEVTNVVPGPHEIQVTLKDVLTGEEKTVECQQVIVSVGPFTDQFMQSWLPTWKPKLLPSKGSHLWIDPKALPIKTPIVIQTKDNRVIFVIPQNKGVLVGTTEIPIKNAEFDMKPSEEEISYLIENIENYFPEHAPLKDHIVGSFSGVRPLVKEEGRIDRGKTARVHKIFAPYSNVQVIVGGKYTTFRTMAADVAQDICHKFDVPYNCDKTIAPLRQVSKVLPREEFTYSSDLMKEIIETELPRTLEDVTRRRIGDLSPLSDGQVDEIKSLLE